jgi:Flp pilus assembly pilin Flp
MTRWLFTVKLARNEDGQDLLEYALLASFIGIALVLLMPTLQTALGDALDGWGSAVYDLWLP